MKILAESLFDAVYVEARNFAHLFAFEGEQRLD
jgi:hypothetical protein